jgi:hypothetical protein
LPDLTAAGAAIGRVGGKICPNLLDQAEAARDALANLLKRKHATYAGGYKNGKVAAGCSSNPSGCAEDDIV